MQQTKRHEILIILLLSGLMWQIVNMSSTKDDYYRLYNNIFADNFYKKEIRPAESLNDPLEVAMSFHLLSIVDVNEKQQMLATSARLEMKWDDDYLEWNSTEYGGIEDLLVPQKKVYVPDIVLSNSVSAQKELGYDELPVRLSSDGTLLWEPTLLLSTDCDIDITYFPFETQKCNVDFETAVSKSTEIDIDVDQAISAIDLSDFTKNGQWELVETKAENLSDEDSKTKIRFSLVIKRRRTFYVLNIILPVFFLSLTASLVFALPADEGEKMGTGITVLLAFAVYLTIVSDLIPNTSLQVSILGLYLTILLGLSSLSVIICVFILRLHNRDEDRPVGPRTASFTRFFRVALCMKEGDHDKPSSNQVTPTPSDTRNVNVSMRSQVSLNNSIIGGRHDPRLMQDHRQQQAIRSQISLNKSVGGYHDSRRLPDPMMSATMMSEEPDEEMTWQLVAETLDWIFFVVFTMSTFIVTLVCLLYLHFGSIADAPSL